MTATATTGGWVAQQFGVSLTDGHSPIGVGLSDLLRLALRRNPRRAHLLVSTVLGKHLPVVPGQVTGAGRSLGLLVEAVLGDAPLPDGFPESARAAVLEGDLSGLPDPSPHDVLVLGYCETATALGHLVAEQLDAPYLHSTRLPKAGVPVVATFEEGHSHATTHYVQPEAPGWLRPGVPLVLVDDEISTGRTLSATIAALHRVSPRNRYVVAALVDLRPGPARTELQTLAARLSVRIDVVSLASGSASLPEDLVDRVAELLPAPPRQPTGLSAPLVEDDIDWPAEVPLGGRHGVADHAGIRSVAAAAAMSCRTLLPDATRRLLVVGTEEFMYLPLLVAAELDRDPLLEVGFQSTTRSPVHPVDDPGYPIRRRFAFTAADGSERFLYNATMADGSDPDAVLLLGEPTGSPLRTVGRALAAAGMTTVAATFVPPGTQPLAGPTFGSYPADDVRWLLTDLSGLDLEGDVSARESAIQAGLAHYAESLPREYQPDPVYRKLFDEVLTESAARLAHAVGSVTELVLAERGHDIALASLARAGTPVGVLMRRWAKFRYGLDLPHYAVSIVRGRGIDEMAMKWLAGHHDPASVVFVDGWTGKGAIARELSAALAELRASTGLAFSDDLAVLADPGECVRTFGTRDDFLIPSACLNSTVSGLVSRTVLNRNLLGSNQFHGAKYYREFAGQDVSGALIDSVVACFAEVAHAVDKEVPQLRAADRTPTFVGWAAIERIREEYAISSVNFVKPGVGETTRVLLRRVPWRILLRDNDNPDHRHLRLLAADRGVPIEIRPDLPYSCVGLIRQLSETDRGEG